MSYAADFPRYIESAHYLKQVGEARLVIVDGGSRGELFDPFVHLQKGIEVVAFEPDSEAEGKSPHRPYPITYIDKGLWKSTGAVDIHLARGRATSSVYPPNMELLANFPESLGAAVRTTEKVVSVPCISIDDAVREGLCKGPDFIKLDVHSAEYEALIGAERSLEKVVGVLVETWHNPIHRGQHLHGEVEAYLNQKGFFLFDLRLTSPWKLALDGQTSPLDRACLVSSESLFLRSFSGTDQAITKETALFAIACADLFRYTHYAILLSRQFGSKGILSPILQKEIEECLLEIQKERMRRSRFRRAGRQAVEKILGWFSRRG